MGFNGRIAAVLVLGAILVAGCATSGTNFDSSKVSEIKKGETTEAELIQKFGQPNQRTIDSEGLTHLTWQYVEAHASGKNFIPFYGAFHQESNTSNKMLMVTLRDGVVEKFTSSEGANETSTGHL